MLQGEHSAILSTFIKLPFVIKIFVLTIFKWQFYTGFAVHTIPLNVHVQLFSRATGLIWAKPSPNSILQECQ